MDEFWRELSEFPMYAVSDHGRVMNLGTERVLQISLNNRGQTKVNLNVEGVKYTRAVSVLVAEEFVDGQDETYNTVMHLDLDRVNDRAVNLVWRPRWFVRRYFSQFPPSPWFNTTRKVVDFNSGYVYLNMVEAALVNGLLLREIYRSLHDGRQVSPTGQIFGFA